MSVVTHANLSERDEIFFLLIQSIFSLSFFSLFMVPTAQQRTGSTTTSNSNRPVIAFVGAGNMAEAIIGGLYASGHPASHLRYSEPVQERRRYMQQKYPEITATHDNNEAVRGAQVVILAVKPQVMRLVVQTLELPTTENVLVISIAAGIRTTDIARWFKDNNAAAAEIPVVRCMPNTPALIGEGAVGLYAVEAVSTEQRQLAETIMGSIAKKVCWVQQEKLMDTITALSGSGPAYYFLFMEAMRRCQYYAIQQEDHY